MKEGLTCSSIVDIDGMTADISHGIGWLDSPGPDPWLHEHGK
jgi:hypothetical protein